MRGLLLAIVSVVTASATVAGAELPERLKAVDDGLFRFEYDREGVTSLAARITWEGNQAFLTEAGQSVEMPSAVVDVQWPPSGDEAFYLFSTRVVEAPDGIPEKERPEMAHQVIGFLSTAIPDPLSSLKALLADPDARVRDEDGKFEVSNAGKEGGTAEWHSATLSEDRESLVVASRYGSTPERSTTYTLSWSGSRCLITGVAAEEQPGHAVGIQTDIVWDDVEGVPVPVEIHWVETDSLREPSEVTVDVTLSDVTVRK